MRSSIDGATHRLDLDEVATVAAELGVSAPPRGVELRPWLSRRSPLPGDGWVVTPVAAAAGREGEYFNGSTWTSIEDVTDTAEPGELAPGCDCRACTAARRGYLAHLWRQEEITAGHLLGWHNLHALRRRLEG